MHDFITAVFWIFMDFKSLTFVPRDIRAIHMSNPIQRGTGDSSLYTYGTTSNVPAVYLESRRSRNICIGHTSFLAVFLDIQ